MNRTDFIYLYYRRLFRNHIDHCVMFADNLRVNDFLASLYWIDNNIEYFIRKGHGSSW